MGEYIILRSYGVCQCISGVPMVCASVSVAFLWCVSVYQWCSYGVCQCISGVPTVCQCISGVPMVCQCVPVYQWCSYGVPVVFLRCVSVVFLRCVSVVFLRCVSVAFLRCASGVPTVCQCISGVPTVCASGYRVQSCAVDNTHIKAELWSFGLKVASHLSKKQQPCKHTHTHTHTQTPPTALMELFRVC